MGVPLKVATASSGVIIGMGDCITIWPYIMVGAIIPLFVAQWLVGQVLGGIIGAHILIRAKVRAIRYILIGVMFYTSFGLVANALTKLGVIGDVSGVIYVVVLVVVIAITIMAILDKLPKISGGDKNHGEK